MRIKRVKLWDHFSYNGRLDVANIQPQYGLIHLNYWRRGELKSSADVKVEPFFRSLEALFDVTITPNKKATP